MTPDTWTGAIILVVAALILEFLIDYVVDHFKVSRRNGTNNHERHSH